MKKLIRFHSEQSAAAFMRGMAEIASIYDLGCSRAEKKPTICIMPGCGLETTHNGGYCSAAHCREHRQIRRAMRRTGVTASPRQSPL